MQTAIVQAEEDLEAINYQYELYAALNALQTAIDGLEEVIDLGPGYRFDFGSASSPIANGYERVTDTTIYNEETGFGFAAAADGNRDQSAPDDLRRDFILANGSEFIVDVPDGEYDVKVITGAQTDSNDTTFTLEDEEGEGGTRTEPGEFAEYETTVKVTDGQLNIGFTGSWARVNAVEIVNVNDFNVKYDFGSATSPVSYGWKQVTNTMIYDSEIGYGLDKAVAERDRGGPDDVRRDFVINGDYQFTADLRDGDYLVRIIAGDDIASNTSAFIIEGEDFGTINSASGQFETLEETVTVTDGQLNIEIGGVGRINGLEVYYVPEDVEEPGAPAEPGNGSGGGASPNPRPNPTPPTPTPEPGQVIVDNDVVKVERVTTEDGKTKVTTTVNKERLTKMIEEEDFIEKVTVNIEKKSGEVGEVNVPASVSKLLAEKNPNAVIEIESEEGTYRFPASQVNYADLSAQLGSEDFELTISINEVTPEVTTQSTKESVVSNYVEFKVVASVDGNEVELHEFTGYVEGEIIVSADVNPERSVVMKVEADGSYTSVPTVFNGDVATFKSMSSGTFVVVESEVSFNDLPVTFWAKDHFDKLAAKHIFQGNNGDVMPNAPTSRINLAVLITRSLGLEARSEYNQQFSDVNGDEWYVSELMAAVEAGIITGKNDGSFDAYAVVTREQAAAMISRAMKLVEFDESKLDGSKKSEAFADYASVSAFAKADVELLLQAGIVDERDSFNPKASTTRAQMAKMVDEFLQFVNLSN
ncbi:S-layer homology domain-containing protein [Bacillus solitudinis]|uniref:S-layer homology domain-containing protein n=1 Tax=Bacillus solitudinis TaxID=2014074 RepID=UPI003873015A